jgi:hypothetical protein
MDEGKFFSNAGNETTLKGLNKIEIKPSNINKVCDECGCMADYQKDTVNLPKPRQKVEV